MVPAGYQRNFAQGKHVLVIEKSTLIAREIGVRDNFVASHFLRVILNGEPSDAAEDQFARIEGAALPLIRTLVPFSPKSQDQIYALKATMAMLWSRSFPHEIVARRIRQEVAHEYRQSAPFDRRIRRRFRQQHGRYPKPAEIEAVVDESIETMLHERLHDVNSMLDHHNKAFARFDPLHVALYQPARGCEFVTSDNPVLLARDPHLIQVGAHTGLALGDASFIFLPVSRFVGACLTDGDEGDMQLDRTTTRRLKQATWRNAVARVACHPSLQEWATACNVSLQSVRNPLGNGANR